MIRHRLDAQVVASSAQMDGALAAGIRPPVLVELVNARTRWHDEGEIPALTCWAWAALHTDAAREWDAVFTHAALRHLPEQRRP